ncbi:MAG TPA: copper chaperone PCu(A)C [Gammaproteobacteria bacterium]|nr:copper chaperone PCu(A)C [Gammaproteobacteria bacterium]
MRRLWLLLLSCLVSQPLFAGEPLQARDAWVREAPPTAQMLAAYLTLLNPGPVDRVVTRVSSPRFDHVMLHRSEVVDGIARMQHVERLVVPAHGTVRLEPGGLHLMMPAPQRRLVAGEQVRFVLELEDGEQLRVEAEVKKKP